MRFEDYHGELSHIVGRRATQVNPKRLGRQALLAEQPALRRRIDFVPLRQIIDFTEFRCSPLSSIARDEAIAGSDIDGGLVIVREAAAPAQELAFIEELRRQDFHVYHPTEAAAADAALAEASFSDPGFNKLIHEANVAKANEVAFLTAEQLAALQDAPMTVKTYALSRYRIPELLPQA